MRRALTGPRNRIRATSLVEVSIAFAVLGLALIPLIGLFSSAGKQARQTADYTMAIALETKVSDEMRTTAWEDPHFVDEVEADPTPLADASVVESTSPFFDAIEDAERPYGLMQRGVDPAVGPRMPMLAQALRSFRVGSRSAPAPQSTTQVASLVMSVGWEDFQQKKRALSLQVGLPRYGSFTDRPPATEVRLRADELIRTTLYPTLGSPLSTSLPAAGGDLAMVRQLGDLLLIAVERAAERPSYADRVARLRAQVADPSIPAPDAARARGGLARALEAQAASELVSIVYLAEPLGGLKDRYEAARLGQPAPDMNAYAPRLVSLVNLRSDFDQDLSTARATYASIYNDGSANGLPPQNRKRAFMKYVELTKLSLLTAGGDLSALTTPLEAFAREQAGRNPNLERFARQELALSRTVDLLRSNYPRPRRADAYREFGERLTPALTRILAGGER